MFDNLKNVEETYNNLRDQLYSPEVSADPKRAIEINKKLSDLQELYDLYQEYKQVNSQIHEAKEIFQTESDEEVIELAKAQLDEAETQKEEIEQKLKIALLPKDPNDDKNIYLEIRPAAWWDEAWLFASELLRSYLRYAELKWRRAEIMDHQESWIWALKMATVKISGDKVYSKLKFESGVHRVQRIPATESQWRVHTSTVTVAIMPEVEDVNVNLDMNDIEIDTYAASSAGGQHANKNETWVRMTHKPTWIVVNCGDSRSQLQNKEKAITVLKAKLYQMELEKQQQEQKSARLSQVWTWDRSEKIRTYNFPQDRLTDHRIKHSWSNLPAIMNGELDDIISTLIVEDQAILLAEAGEDLWK